MTAVTEDAYVQWARAVNLLLADLLRRVDVELAEIRDSIVDLDHTKASRQRVDELHSRVDLIAEGLS